MKIKYFIYYVIFEIISYKIFQKIFFGINEKYDYLEWVYYFYYPGKNIAFYFYLYFIFTTSVFFTFLLWYKVYNKTKVVGNE